MRGQGDLPPFQCIPGVRRGGGGGGGWHAIGPPGGGSAHLNNHWCTGAPIDRWRAEIAKQSVPQTAVWRTDHRCRGLRPVLGSPVARAGPVPGRRQGDADASHFPDQLRTPRHPRRARMTAHCCQAGATAVVPVRSRAGCPGGAWPPYSGAGPSHQPPPSATNRHQPPLTAKRQHVVPAGFSGKPVQRKSFFSFIKDRPGHHTLCGSAPWALNGPTLSTLRTAAQTWCRVVWVFVFDNVAQLSHSGGGGAEVQLITRGGTLPVARPPPPPSHFLARHHLTTSVPQTVVRETPSKFWTSCTTCRR